jgi:ribulose-phosphate 3-epimerase
MVRPIKVVPAILTEDPQALAKMVRQAETFCDYVQFDIMDGRFVPSQSIKYEHIVSLNTKLGWEVHLMVERPEDYVDDFSAAGAKKIVFHYEASPTPEKAIGLIRAKGIEVGIALNPETRVSTCLPLLGKIDSVLFLTVNPGYYGSPFRPEVMEKVVELRRVHPEIEIGVDGGIKEGNIAGIARSGVDSIYVGSAILLQPQPAASYRHLSALARKNAPQ